MIFTPPRLDIVNLKRKMDMNGLTIQIAAENHRENGRFYMLWRNGNFVIIQAEPWWRQGVVFDEKVPPAKYVEEHRALWYLQEVLQTMLDNIVFDGEQTWAHLVRLKDGSFRLVYTKRQMVRNCMIWTKVVELDDIELTRFTTGYAWEGIYEGNDVDLYIAWNDIWASFVADESNGHKLVESMGVEQYFFDLKAHVSTRNGVIIGIMLEALVGRPVTHSDRSVVFEAIADIQRHGIIFSFQICDIYITEQGVRFASASSAKYYRNRDVLAKEAEIVWEILADMFDNMDKDPLAGVLCGSRSMISRAIVIPRLPSPDRPISLTPEEAFVRWVWSSSITIGSDRGRGHRIKNLTVLDGLSEDPTTRRNRRIKGDNRLLLPPDDISSDFEPSGVRVESEDEPLTVRRGLALRHHPYARPGPKRLLLPREFM